MSDADVRRRLRAAHWAAVCVLLLSCGGGDGPGSAGPTPTAAVGLAPLAGHFGGEGTIDGGPGDARLSFPLGLAVDAAGHVLVSDAAIRRIAPDGTTTTLALRDPDGNALPRGRIAHGPNGHMVLVGPCNRVLRISPQGEVSAVPYPPPPMHRGLQCHSETDSSAVIDGEGTIVIADALSHVVRRIDAADRITTIAGMEPVQGQDGDWVLRPGSRDGTGPAASFDQPAGIAADAAGNLYVTELGNKTVRRITPQGHVTTVAGRAGEAGTQDGPGWQARFVWPQSIAVGNDGSLYVADKYGPVRRIGPDGMVGTLPARGDGIAVLPDQSIVVSDPAGDVVRRIRSADTSATTLAGVALENAHVDGHAGAARFLRPSSIVADAAGNVYVADRHTVRKVSRDGRVTTLAGDPALHGSEDGWGAQARLRETAALAIDARGTLYVLERPVFESKWSLLLQGDVVRTITPDGRVGTLAGDPRVRGHRDGQGAGASFHSASALWVGPEGHVFVADTFAVRRIAPDGQVVTVAGEPNQRGEQDGTGASARFSHLHAITGDADGNMVLIDGTSLRRMTPDGTVTTLGRVDAFPRGPSIALDAAGGLWVPDTNAFVVRRRAADGTTQVTVGSEARQGVRFGPLPGSLDTPLGVAFLDPKTLAVLTPGGIVRVTLP